MFSHRVLIRNFIFIHHVTHFPFCFSCFVCGTSQIYYIGVDLVQGLEWAVREALQNMLANNKMKQKIRGD